MLVIGLTGGIGSGKSTVAALLEQKGAVRIDTDAVARLVVQPGEAAHEAVVERFGEDLLDPRRNIDRAALASIVFSDPVALADLEAIVHPAVEQIVAAQLNEESQTDHIVVVEVPLLVNSDGTLRRAVDAVLVVDVPEDVAISRLVELRNMTESDARARSDAQVPREARLRAADFIIVNIGTLKELQEMANGAWRWMQGLAAERQGPTR